ncbi:hypothetical protein K1719_033499 [Acacia pycnantha]|nr:hypothetical protein K1719_033499 [Acacia pycnantha]
MQEHFSLKLIGSKDATFAIVHVGWNEVDGVVEDRVLDLVRRLQACQKKLVLWSKSEFPNFRKAIDQLKIKLGRCYSGGMSAARLEEAEEIVKQIEEAWRNEETYWWQRSRVSWLNCGDRNTKFFHNTVIQRRQRNKILRLKDDSGRWMEDSEEINKAFSGFYSELFQTSGGRSLDQALSYVSQVVNENDNIQLMEQVSNQEIERAVFQIGANKAPGPDGYSALFYQAAWKEISKEVFHIFKLGEGHDITALALNKDNTNLLVSTLDKELIIFIDPAFLLAVKLEIKVVDQMLKLGWEGDGLKPLIKS